MKAIMLSRLLIQQNKEQRGGGAFLYGYKRIIKERIQKRKPCHLRDAACE